MWDLTNRTPFSAFAGFDRDNDGKSFWLVWVKATFRMRHGRSCLFERRQVELFKGPQYRSTPEAGDLLADSDICFTKPRPEIILTGHGYRPANIHKDEGYAVNASLGSWRKELQVLPAQKWSDRLKPENSPQDEDGVFLGFSNAYGGVDYESEPGRPPQEFSENPIGKGYSASLTAAKGKNFPRLLSMDEKPERWDSPLKPVSFACVPKERPRRTRFSGTYDQRWMRQKSPLLPDDFDERYWQSVDDDQLLNAAPASGTQISLTNMMPAYAELEGGVFSTELPVLDLELLTRFKGKWQEVAMALQTVHLFPDEGLLTVAYSGAMPILAVANDVLVEKSEIALRGQSGFRVRPRDADQFDPTNTEVSA